MNTVHWQTYGRARYIPDEVFEGGVSIYPSGVVMSSFINAFKYVGVLLHREIRE